MTRPICPLCQTETNALDSYGICQRVSITHDAIRHPDRYPVEKYPELWELIASGRPVFPIPADTKPQRNKQGAPRSHGAEGGPVSVSRHLGDLRVSSEIIAERTGNQHKNVLQLIRAYREDLEAFGPITFKTRKGAALPQGGFGKSTEVAYLNEQQSTLIISYMRNSPAVREFKKGLVTAFYQMRQELARPLSDEEIITQALQITALRLGQFEAQAAQEPRRTPQPLGC